jgi:hypothetical protein
MSFRTNALKVQAFAGALYGIQVGTTTMAQVNADITSGGFTNTINSYYASSFGNVANATVAASVAANLGLTGDALASGTAYITAQLNGAAAGARGAVISNILDLFAGLASDATFGAAATAWNAKVDAANAYTGASNVAIGSTVGQGSVFTLTTGADNFTGTAGNDTFIADATVDAVSSVADTVDGGAGEDTFKLFVDDTNDIALPDTLANIENVVIKQTATYAEGEDFTIAGFTSVNTITLQDGATGIDTTADARFVLTVGAGQKVVLDGVQDGLDADTANEEGELEIGSASTVASLSLEVDGLGDANTTGANTGDLDVDVAGTGVKTVSIKTQGSASFMDLLNTGGAVTALNITGDKAITMASTLPNTIKTIDATAATGAVTLKVGYAVDGPSDALSVKGGTGADKIDVSAILGAADTVSPGADILIDGGAGIDILVVDENLDAEVDTDTEIVNFESIELAADAALNLDGLNWVTEVRVNADITNEIINNIGANVGVNLVANITDVTLTHAAAGRPGTQSMTVTVGKASTDLTVGTLSIDAIENITLNSVLGSTSGNTITSMENDALRILTITGTEDLSVTPESISAELNSSAFTGDLVVNLTAQAAAISINLGTGDNTVTIDADDDNAHEITLGSGVNTIDINNENSVYTDATANMMTISGFKGGSGGDVLELDDTAGVATVAELVLIQRAVDDALAADSGLTLVEAAEAAVDAFAAAGNDLYWFEFAGDTYVIYEDGTDADAFDIDEDFIIKLVGTDLGLDAVENIVY